MKRWHSFRLHYASGRRIDVDLDAVDAVAEAAAPGSVLLLFNGIQMTVEAASVAEVHALIDGAVAPKDDAAMKPYSRDTLLEVLAHTVPLANDVSLEKLLTRFANLLDDVLDYVDDEELTVAVRQSIGSAPKAKRPLSRDKALRLLAQTAKASHSLSTSYVTILLNVINVLLTYIDDATLTNAARDAVGAA